MLRDFKRSEKFWIRLSGSPRRPSIKYLRDKAYKYFVIFPKIQTLRFFKTIFPIFKKISSNQKIIFIGGLHRSGTSTLYKTVMSHPDISGIIGTSVPEDEGQFLQTVYPAPRDLLFAFNQNLHFSSNSPLVTVENKHKLLKQWGNYWNTNKPILLEKSPPNILKTNFLHALFEGSLIIIIVRHPIAYSMALDKWLNHKMETIIEHWFLSHEILLNDLNETQETLILTFEEILENPKLSKKKIFNVIGVDESNAIDFNLNPKINEFYFKSWEENQHIAFEKIVEMEKKYVSTLSKFGYSLLPPYKK